MLLRRHFLYDGIECDHQEAISGGRHGAWKFSLKGFFELRKRHETYGEVQIQVARLEPGRAAGAMVCPCSEVPKRGQLWAAERAKKAQRRAILAPTPGPRFSVPGPIYGDSGIAALMASDALSAAACNDFVERCA